jgi:hypothetical protein
MCSATAALARILGLKKFAPDLASPRVADSVAATGACGGMPTLAGGELASARASFLGRATAAGIAADTTEVKLILQHDSVFTTR